MLRPCQEEDIARALLLFYDTVHTVNRRDYSPEECDAWAPRELPPEDFAKSFLHRAFVVEEEGRLRGFITFQGSELDCLYVASHCQGQGVGRALLRCFEEQAEPPYETHASKTARPFFEHFSYRVVEEEQVLRRGVLLTRYFMRKDG